MLYINDFCSYTAGGTISKEQDLSTLKATEKHMVFAQEPDYKDVIPPMQLRRMSKPIRISIAAVKHMLNKPNMRGQAISAINVGTALGLLSDSETFLYQMVQQDEQMLTPTSFIQSTQNTIGGQIALMLKCTAHNMTFTQRGHSFEHALLDIDLLDESPEDNYLVGAVDEMTPHFYTILNKLMWQYQRTDKDIDLGEGTGFFLLSKNKKQDTICALAGYHSFVTKDVESVLSEITTFLETHGISNPQDCNWVMGDLSVNEWDNAYSAVQQKWNLKNTINYKQYTSNFATVSAAGLAFAVKHHMEQGSSTTIMLTNYLKYWSIYLLKG